MAATFERIFTRSQHQMTQVLEVLILDDEHDTADMMSELLALYFPEAVLRVAYTGEQAVQLGLERRPTAAIFDLEMAGLGGEGAANALRSEFHGPPPLLIALSGNVVRLSELRKTGPFDHLLSKPVDIAAVVELLGRRG